MQDNLALNGAGSTSGPVADHSELHACRVDGKNLVQARLGDRFVLLPAKCPHRGAPMLEADLIGPFIVCSRHGATFDLRTGKWVRGPACKDIEVRVVTDAPPGKADGEV